MKGLFGRVVWGRWAMLFASQTIMAMNGSGYMFGLYSNHIKSSFGYDQSGLNLVSFFKDLGSNLGVISGLLYEVAPPWLVLLVGAALNFFAYFMLWAAVSGRTAAPDLWLVCLYMGLAANSLSFPNTAALVTCVRNFPHHRGCLLGLLKGYIGLSGAIMTQIYHAIYGDDSKALILMVAWLPSAVSLASLPLIRIIKPTINNQLLHPLKPFYSLLHISLALAASLTAIIIAQTKLHFSKPQYIAAASPVVLLLLLPLAVVVNQGRLMLPKLPDTDISTPVSVEELQSSSSSMSWYKNIFNRPPHGDDHTILQAILNVDMATLFVATTCGVGGALTVVDNLGQIGASLGYAPRTISTFVSLVSVWNFLGRVVAGYASEFLLVNYGFPRPLMLTCVIFLSCVGYVLIALAVPNTLYLASMITGFCLGAQLPLTATIVSELYGLKHYSTLYNVGSMSSPVGSYIFNVRVAGWLYDREGERQNLKMGVVRQVKQELKCKGVVCYRVSFLIIMAASIFGSLVSMVLVLRTRGFYKGDIYGRFEKVEQKDQQITHATLSTTSPLRVTLEEK